MTSMRNIVHEITDAVPAIKLQHDASPYKHLSMLTLSGFSRSAMAVPSARNSGLLRISKCTEGSEQFLLNTC